MLFEIYKIDIFFGEYIYAKLFRLEHLERSQSREYKAISEKTSHALVTPRGHRDADPTSGIVRVSMETLCAICVGWSRAACRHPDKRLMFSLSSSHSLHRRYYTLFSLYSSSSLRPLYYGAALAFKTPRRLPGKKNLSIIIGLRTKFQ